MEVEKYLSVQNAVERVTGVRPSPGCCWRWVMKGQSGVKLRSVMLGARRLTTTAWVQEFIEGCTEAAENASVVTIRAREANAPTSSMQKAKEELAGMLAKRPRGRPRKNAG